MKDYEEWKLEIIWFNTEDVITASLSNGYDNSDVDDFGGWDGDWFSSNNG